MNLDPLDAAAQRNLRARLASPPKATLLDVLGRDRKHTLIQTLTRMFAARFGPGKLSPAEYAKYGTGDVSLDELKRFAGVRVQKALHAVCNDRTWFAITKHKLLFEKLMMGAGLPTAETLAVFDPKGRSLGFPLLRTRDELTAFLALEKNLPCFCKPVTGTYSLGCFMLERGRSKNLLIDGHRSATGREVAAFMEDFSAKGYLFQRPLAPDPSLAKQTGTSGLVSLRFFVRLEPSGPAVQACVAKLPGKGQVADNFWRDGAVLCGVDTENGAVLHAVTDSGGNIEAYTGVAAGKKPILGQKIPGFSNASDLVMRAAPVLAGVRTQSWDVAMTKKGPVLLEVNFGGDLSLIQLGHGKGILTAEYCEHLKRNGYRGRLP